MDEENQNSNDMVNLSDISDEEQNFLFVMIVASILLFIIPSILLMLIKKDTLQDGGKAYAYKTFNFELCIIILMACVNFVPVYGKVLAFIFFVLNLWICVKAAIAINSKQKFEYPIYFNFMKMN